MTETTRLAPGDKAPAFSLPDADGKKVSLADYKGRRVVVYFYPAASTPGCTKQACDFRDNLHDLNDAGLDVVGISPDKPEKLAKFRDAEGLTFPLLSDPDRKVLTAWGAYGEKQMYGKTVTGMCPWLTRALANIRPGNSGNPSKNSSRISGALIPIMAVSTR